MVVSARLSARKKEDLPETRFNTSGITDTAQNSCLMSAEVYWLCAVCVSLSALVSSAGTSPFLRKTGEGENCDQDRGPLIGKSPKVDVRKWPVNMQSQRSGRDRFPFPEKNTDPQKDGERAYCLLLGRFLGCLTSKRMPSAQEAQSGQPFQPFSFEDVLKISLFESSLELGTSSFPTSLLLLPVSEKYGCACSLSVSESVHRVPGSAAVPPPVPDSVQG